MDEQKHRLEYLVNAFCADSEEYKDLPVPDNTAEQRQILRSLMNIRMPRKLPEAVLAVQDEYLKTRVEEKGIVLLSSIPVIRDGLSVWQGDITRLACDVIVNAANPQMLGCFVPMHSCIDNCIHTYAGVQLRAECSRYMNRMKSRYGADYEQPIGIPVLTDAYNLPARKVIHVAGPIVYDRVTPELEEALASCYRNSLDICKEHHLNSIAFCCISTGVYRFPNQRAAKIAVETVETWMKEHPGAVDRVIFNVFKEEDRQYYEALV